MLTGKAWRNRRPTASITFLCRRLRYGAVEGEAMGLAASLAEAAGAAGEASAAGADASGAAAGGGVSSVLFWHADVKTKAAMATISSLRIFSSLA